MTKPVIEIRNLSKQYTIGERAPYGNLREEIVQTLTSPFRRLTSHSSQTTHDENKIWALKDVSFEVNEGEVLGIIGRNGAGKSTLLKILSRITEPTEGEVRMRGRVGSLLEVGTGFHPELTGRENIFLNGALLGMSRQEINAKFDEIVAFAEIEKFLDTPVKRYSSGMYVRLAFAVAAHLEPEILIIDEVLAVGDAAFQKKCLGKMGDMAKGGRTVLFVSHNMTAIEMLCDRIILLNEGKIEREGISQDIVRFYLGDTSDQLSVKHTADYNFKYDSTKPAQIRRLRIFDNKGRLNFQHNILDPVKIMVDFELSIDFPTLFLECVFHRVGGFSEPYGHGSFLSTNADRGNYERGRNGDEMHTVFPMKAGKYIATLFLSAPLLNAGIYEIELYLTTGPNRQDTCNKALFKIIDNGSFASIVRKSNRSGFLAYPLKWAIQKKNLRVNDA